MKNIFQSAIKHWKRIAISVFVILCSIALGALAGIHYYKRYEYAGAVGMWMTGVQALEAGEYDKGLFYVSGAIGKKADEPLFHETLAQAYELRGNIQLAIAFYESALALWKKEGHSGPIKKIERKIQVLQSRLKQGEG